VALRYLGRDSTRLARASGPAGQRAEASQCGLASLGAPPSTPARFSCSSRSLPASLCPALCTLAAHPLRARSVAESPALRVCSVGRRALGSANPAMSARPPSLNARFARAEPCGCCCAALLPDASCSQGVPIKAAAVLRFAVIILIVHSRPSLHVHHQRARARPSSALFWPRVPDPTPVSLRGPSDLSLPRAIHR
jgi:hypothetical protein